MIESSTSKPASLKIEELKNIDGTTLGTKVTLQLPIQYIKI